jgi:spermidine synthase
MVILFYLLTWLFSWMGLVSKTIHRKFWNVLLLITFMITGLIGLAMVMKINYKLAIPFFDDLVKYHVDFGIGMVIIGLIHFWWHLNYYLHLLKSERIKESDQIFRIENDVEESILKVSAFLLGSTSIIAQITLLREFLSVFNGNELVIGLVLANWMVLTGIGASLGKNSLRIIKTSTIIVSGLLILSILPFITAFLINFLKNKVFPMGAMIGIFEIFLASLILLIPFCLLSGYLFTFISKSYSEIRNQNETGPVYGFESAGSIVGGLLSGILFIFIFSSAESLLVLALINSAVLFLISLKGGRRKLIWYCALVAFPAFASLFFQPEKVIRSWVYPNQAIEVSKDSPHGNIVITRQENMWSVYNNNILLFDSENFMVNEEAVHFAMVQHPQATNVLLISGGLSGQITELKKYKQVSVDYVEENRWLLALMQDSLAKIMENRITLHSIDPLRFIRNSTKKYDVAILNLPGPSTLQSNRFYTLEFFTLLKEKLSLKGVLSFGLPAPVNYLNSESVELNSTIYSTLKKVFQDVIIIPGEKNYFLASDAQLKYNITRAVQENRIETRYVNPDYFNDDLLKRRGEIILSSLNPAQEINQNLKPVLYRQQLNYWLSHFKGSYWSFAVLAGALGLLVFIAGSIPSKAMFIAGFSASAIEILLLFGLQIYFGNIYLLTSFVFTSFMAGLVAGSFFGKSLKISKARDYLSINLIITGIFSAVIALMLFAPSMSAFAPSIIYSIYFAATFAIGCLTGLQFTLASLNRMDSFAKISAKTYSYDLFGSALGALVITLYLVPKTGIVASVLAISFLNLLFGIFLTLRKK